MSFKFKSKLCLVFTSLALATVSMNIQAKLLDTNVVHKTAMRLAYLNESVTPREYENIEKAARRGNAEAEYSLGVLYLTGNYVEKNLTLALKWFKRAAEQGNFNAIYNIGQIYFQGKGSQQSYKQAMHWFTIGAQKGHGPSAYHLGVMYNQGLGVEINFKMANMWFARSAEQRYAPAEYAMGLAYSQGLGFGQNNRVAMQWFEKSSKQDYAPAFYAIGQAYEKGLGVDKDEKIAFKNYLRSAELGDMNGQSVVAKMYLLGIGTEKSVKEYVKWIRKSSQGGSLPAKVELAMIYREGKGIKQNHNRSLELYQQAANAGSARAMYEVGIAFEQGLSITPNKLEALEWFKKSAAKEFPAAEFKLFMYFSEGYGSLSKQEDLYGKIIAPTGEPLITAFGRMISAAIREYPVLSRITQFDLGDARVVSLDLDEVAKSGGEAAERQTAVMYMLARYIMARHYYLTEENLEDFPKLYTEYHRERILQIREDPKRLVLDEFHRTSKAQAVRDQVLVDMREGRKWKVQVALLSQSLDDFDPVMVEFATAVFIMDAGPQQAIDKSVVTFGLSETAKYALANRVHGPRAEGATFLSQFATKLGTNTQLCTSTLGPIELWAFNTTAEDARIRNSLYKKIGAGETRKLLAMLYPAGSAANIVEQRLSKLKESQDELAEDAGASVIDELIEEILQVYESSSSPTAL